MNKKRLSQILFCNSLYHLKPKNIFTFSMLHIGRRTIKPNRLITKPIFSSYNNPLHIANSLQSSFQKFIIILLFLMNHRLIIPKQPFSLYPYFPFY